MTAPLSPEKQAEIVSLRKLPLREIARKTGASVGTISAVLKREKRRPGAKSRAPAPPKPPAAPAAAPETGDVLEQLGECLAVLKRGTEACASEGDWGKVATIQRAIKDVSALVAKLTPPPPPDRETQPDTLAESAAAVAKLFGRLDLIIQQARAK